MQINFFDLMEENILSSRTGALFLGMGSILVMHKNFLLKDLEI